MLIYLFQRFSPLFDDSNANKINPTSTYFVGIFLTVVLPAKNANNRVCKPLNIG